MNPTSACVGPASYDLGTLLAHYIITYHAHMLTEEDNDSHRQVAYKMVKAAHTTGGGSARLELIIGCMLIEIELKLIPLSGLS